MPLIPGVQYEEYWQALTNAFTKDSLDQFLRMRMNKRLDHIVSDGSLPDMTFELLGLAEREGWHVDLVREAHRFNPRNPDLAGVYEKYGLAPEVSIQKTGSTLESVPQSLSASGFEKTIKEHLPLFDIAVFREQLALVEGWVCRIESSGNALGSGFLVGPDLVMTNYHVMENIINDPTLAIRLRCRFDYKALRDGSRQMGTEVPLHENDWNVGFSKYTDAEKRGEPDAELPTVDELDYALVRLANDVGNKPVGAASDMAPARGWVKFPDTFPQLTTPLPLVIAQHPDGAPLKLAMDTDGVTKTNDNKTRVRYATTTESGSSGSPCFSFDWVPLALHHYGDPGSKFHKSTFNQGVPFAMIRDHLKRHNSAGLI